MEPPTVELSKQLEPAQLSGAVSNGVLKVVVDADPLPEGSRDMLRLTKTVFTSYKAVNGIVERAVGAVGKVPGKLDFTFASKSSSVSVKKSGYLSYFKDVQGGLAVAIPPAVCKLHNQEVVAFFDGVFASASNGQSLIKVDTS
jgi:hypothetical protein